MKSDEWQTILEQELPFELGQWGVPMFLFEPGFGVVLAANEAARRVYGYNSKNLAQLHARDLFLPEDYTHWLDRVSQMRKGSGYFAGIWRHQTARGLVAMQLATAVWEVKGERCEWLAAEEAGESYRSAMDLARTEARNRALLQSSGFWHFVLAPDGTIRDAAPGVEGGLGYGASELAGRKMFEFVRSDEAHQLRDLLTVAQAIADEPQVWRHHLRTAVGAWVRVESLLSRYLEPGNANSFLLVSREAIKEKNAAEWMMAGQQRNWESIAEIAAGVAHNFNNILTVVNLYSGLMLAKEAGETEASGSLREIMKAVDRASSITRHLITFASRQLMTFEEMDLNRWLRDFVAKLPEFLGDKIEVKLRLGDNLPMVAADKKMLDLMASNMAANSRDSMKSGGFLTFSTSLETTSEEQLAAHPEARPGEHVCLTISDTGAGIAPEDLPRIFDPFFTTKAVGEGTGLGLAAVYGIVKQHRGWIDVTSRVQHGTSFRIFLPAVVKPDKLQKAMSARKIPTNGKGVILLVEDESAVRSVVRKILASQGYEVLDAASGVEALAVWREASDGISLLLTDVIMPGGMTGWELAEQLRVQKPELKVIFTSGYSKEVAIPAGCQSGSHFLEKPYDPATLLQAVQRTLGGMMEASGKVAARPAGSTQ